MRSFDEIFALAAERKGGKAALEAILGSTKPASPATIAKIPDNRILSAMSRSVFQAGFSWKVVDQKWDAFEQVFEQFDPHFCAHLPEDRFDAALKDARIIRNGAKIRSIMINARFVLDLAIEHGSAAKCFADWPESDYVGLLQLLKKRASRLSGQSAMYFLRGLGRPSFVMSNGVATALIREGVVTKPPSGKRDFATVQAAFNTWAKQSGRDMTSISRTLAMSVDEGSRDYPR